MYWGGNSRNVDSCWSANSIGEFMEITLTKLQSDELAKYAIANNLTSEQYATNILTSWLDSHIKGSLIEQLKMKSNEELKSIIEKEK